MTKILLKWSYIEKPIINTYVHQVQHKALNLPSNNNKWNYDSNFSTKNNKGLSWILLNLKTNLNIIGIFSSVPLYWYLSVCRSLTTNKIYNSLIIDKLLLFQHNINLRIITFSKIILAFCFCYTFEFIFRRF